jgi:glycosyltransferase involved in cell wall biosynthesis
MEGLPKMLVLSDEGPHLSSAGGIQLYRLLETYPANDLAVIARSDHSNSQKLHCQYRALRTPLRRLEQSRFHRWKRSLRAFGCVPPVRLGRIDRLLGRFDPELVLCVMQHAAYYDTAWRFARSRQLPLIVIVHDVNEQFEPVLPFASAANQRRDGEFYRFASRRLCISPEMERFCAELYGARGDVQYPIRGRDLEARFVREAAVLKRPPQLTIGFVGNLNYGYGQELVRILPAFRASGTRLVIYSHPPGGSCAALLAERDVVDFRGFVPAPKAWSAVKSDCDAVILPYPNPAGVMEKLYRYHFPSKLPEYLSLGMPVIVTGPAYATGVAWALRSPGSSAVWTDPGHAAFVRELTELRENAEMRTKLAANGAKAGAAAFDPSRIQSEFYRHLKEAATPVAGHA